MTSTTSRAHRTCPACGTVVRANQVRVRPHRATVVLYALVLPAGVLGYWLGYRAGTLSDELAAACMLPFFVTAWLLPKVRVVRCPTCGQERRVPLRRHRGDARREVR